MQSLADLDFINTHCKGDKTNFRNPKNQIVRYQLLEILVRIAKRKFMDPGQVKIWKEAVTLLLENHMKQLFNKHDQNVWR